MHILVHILLQFLSLNPASFPDKIEAETTGGW